MHGVTTAIVLFVFVCVLFPRLIDNRPQFYAAFAIALVVILLEAIALALGGTQRVVMAIVVATFQVAAVVLLFLSAGGLTVRGLTREMADAFEVIRRGETEKEIIIPLGEQKEKRKRAVDAVGEPAERFDLTSDANDYPRKSADAPTPVPTPAADPADPSPPADPEASRAKPADRPRDAGPLPMD